MRCLSFPTAVAVRPAASCVSTAQPESRSGPDIRHPQARRAPDAPRAGRTSAGRPPRGSSRCDIFERFGPYLYRGPLSGAPVQPHPVVSAGVYRPPLWLTRAAHQAVGIGLRKQVFGRLAYRGAAEGGDRVSVRVAARRSARRLKPPRLTRHSESVRPDDPILAPVNCVSSCSLPIPKTSELSR
jgi:hypothetical protein